MDDATLVVTKPARAKSAAKPLVVDMEGALVRTNMLIEAFVAALFQRPPAVLATLWALRRGPAAFKARIAALGGALDVDSLPVRDGLVAFLERQKAQGRETHLVGVSAHAHVQQLAARLGVFDSAQGGAALMSLEGERKARALAQRFPDGFCYVGASGSDVAVWRTAEAIGLSGASPPVARAARKLGKTVEYEQAAGTAGLATWGRALRAQQWAKNLLIFVPATLGHQIGQPLTFLKVAAGFACLCVMASATYLVNDMGDLASDRRHRSKRFRPLASGALPITHAFTAIAPMMIASLAAACWLSRAFFLGLVSYTVLTLAYSMRLKRVAMLDVTVLGLLYTLRLVMGQALVGGAPSTWLLTFSMFFFGSLALTKRHSELAIAAASDAPALAGRGYRASDLPLTLAMGVSLSAAAILLVVIYLTNEAFPSGLYVHPRRLWAAPVLIQLWLARVWLLAHRGEMNDDPVAFALRDRYSLLLGAALGADVVSAVV